ncbi:hypothetical protein BLA60_34700 [Actinophytocola xinjiangensis]|uniref:Tetratricopeptide repeat protein n=1 Tax=Actinophytocola xinjiangensis TaxID=485602 RepID=A0A7Z1AVR3_9PSEU|nr:hypothetical protein [Actinophytocola xinjiangensis]OLF05669.1 hypothetical protein BLA60_34700 [Actinophytocola xinjiangensis]
MSDWRRLHDEGVALAGSGDLDGAVGAFEAALAAVDGEPVAVRASVLVSLAALVEHRGELDRAVELAGEAIGLARDGGEPLTLVNACALRAQALLRGGRAEEGFADLDLGLTVDDEPVTVVLHVVRTGLLMATGRLDEAEESAIRSVELAHAHAPEHLPHAYTNLALIAEAVGDDEHAARCRLLAENPDAPRPVGQRWRQVVELNARAAELAGAGDPRAASAVFDEAYRATLVPDNEMDDVEALVCRAAVTGNRAALAAGVGDLDEALRLGTETIELARQVESRVGDRYGTAADRVTALAARASYLRQRSRTDEALADLDEAVATTRDEAVVASLRTARAGVLAGGGRFEEGLAEATAALDLAGEHAPHLVPYAHVALADLADATGDTAASAEHLTVARMLLAATGDTNAEATTLLSLARLSYLDSEFDAADAHYDDAEDLFTRLGNTTQLVTCLHGRAAIAVHRGRPADALTMLDRVLDALGTDPPPLAAIATGQVRGAALEALGRFAQARAEYLAARDLSDRAGLWHVALGLDWWRADSLTRWAHAAANPDPDTAPDPDAVSASASASASADDLRRQALDVALPAALAAEALRRRFSPGPLRERWVALAAAPATRSALTAITASGDLALTAAYLDHLAATVSLDGPARPALGEVASLPRPPDTTFGPPPRVRVDPAVRGPLDDWIDLAERRYGFAVRSAEVVRSW